LAELPEDASEAEKAKVREEWQQRHDQVLASGGLHIIGTERHESRRIDNQLRGRSGRQGDPGSSRFYLSLEDTLMRIFAPEWVAKLMQFAGMKEDEALQDRMVSRQIEKAQRKVESHNFDIRKNLLDYDDDANDQRKIIYQQRAELMESESVQEAIDNIREDVIAKDVQTHVPPESLDETWKLPALESELAADFGVHIATRSWLESGEELDAAGVERRVQEAVERHFREKETMIGSEIMRQLEKHMMLSVLDQQWKEHLASMDYLRQGIHLRGYAQKQPKQEFKREAFELFTAMLERIKREVISILARVRIR